MRALRRLRAASREEGSAERLLAIVAEATSSERVVLRSKDATIAFGAPLAPGAETADIDVGAGTLTLERKDAAYGQDELELAEILGGEVALSLGADTARAEAKHQTRRFELLQSLIRADVVDGADVVARVASELLEVVSGAAISLHVVSGDALELVTRRTREGEAAAPEWLQRIALDDGSLMATAARERRVVSKPFDALHEGARKVLAPIGVKHVIAVPLVFGDEVLGTLTVAHAEAQRSEHEGLIESAAALVCFGLVHARRLEEARQHSGDLHLVHEIGALVARHLELSDVLRTAVREVARTMGVPLVHLLLVDESERVLAGAASNSEQIDAVTLSLDEPSAAKQAFQQRKPVMIEDAKTDPRISRRVADELGTRSILAVPLLSRGAAIGALALVETRERRRFKDSEIARAVAIANLLAPTIANARMFEDLRKSYAALARAQADVVRHERLAALGELSAVIAHEVRNPLAVIFNSLPPLRKSVPAKSQASLLLDIVAEEASHLNHIVSDLLDFARPYAPHPRAVDLPALVRGAAEAALRATANGRIEVRVDVSQAPSEIVIDGTMLEQALINLIVNAVQASPEGGAVTIRVVEAPWRGVRCEIADEGPGIDEHALSHLFQPFVTTKPTGTGLGLAIVRRITEALGGNVDVTRGPRRGSVFALTLPVG